MFDYFRMYYLELEYGIGFVLTEILFAAGAVLIFERLEPAGKCVRHVLWQIPAAWLVSLMLSTLNQMLLGGFGRNILATGMLILLYCFLGKNWTLSLRLVRGMVYYACYQQALTLSESGGFWMRELLGQGDYHTILDNSTWVMILFILLLAVILINRWAVEDVDSLPHAPLYLILFASGLGVLLQFSANSLEIGRVYEVIVAVSFLFLEMFSYYLLYIVSLKTKENMELVAIDQKQQLDAELLQSFHENLENMHMLRHELRNHLAYIRVLVAEEEYDKLFDYTNQVLGEADTLFTSVSSGNDLVDAVLNHEIQKAHDQGIVIEPVIVAPPELPFEEKDFCSLLSNLIDNAIEATAVYRQSRKSQEAPVIGVSIRPQQDYLFLRVTNPVKAGTKLNALRQGQGLRTTKKDAAFHGYGTKIIRHIAERYNGSVNYEIQDGRFTADVMLDLTAAGRQQEGQRGSL